MKHIVFIIILIITSSNARALDRREIIRYCKTTLDYSGCIKSFIQRDPLRIKIKQKKKKTFISGQNKRIRRGPIEIKVIPYKEY